MSLEILSSPKTWTNLFANSLSANALTSNTLSVAQSLSYGTTTGLTANPGVSQSSATPLPTAFNSVSTVVTTGDSVALPQATLTLVGTQVYCTNTASNNLSCFPFLGDQILPLSTNTQVTVAAATTVVFTCMATGQWTITDNMSSAAAFGSTSNANGLSISNTGQTTLQPASATNPGCVSNTTQSFAGNKTFTGTLAASNLSGSNSGDLTLAAVGSSPNANSASLSAQVLTLQPASATQPGVVSTTTQSFVGSKTFTSPVTHSSSIGLTALAGGGASGATLCPNNLNVFSTVATANDSCILSASGTGTSVVVVNQGAHILAVFPNTGATINALSANVSVQMQPLQKVTFYATSSTSWFTTDLNYSIYSTASTGQSIPNNTITALAYANDSNLVNWTSSRSNNTEFIAPVAGLYNVFLFVDFSANATGDREIIATINGTSGTRIIQFQIPAPATNDLRFGGSALFNFNAGDYVQICVFQVSGAALVLANYPALFAMDYQHP